MDKSPNAAHATQATATARPVIPSAGYRLRSDFVDDSISATLGEDCEVWINTPYGCYQSQGASDFRLPLCDATGVIAVEGTLTASERAAIIAYFGTPQVYMVALCSGVATYGRVMVAYTGGGTTTVTFVGANGVSATRALTASGGHACDLTADGLTAPMAVIWPASLVGNTSLTILSGGRTFTGALPYLGANTALTRVDFNTNNLTGSIPSLSANTALTTASFSSNNLTGYAVAGCSATLTSVQMAYNAFTQAAVDGMLADLVGASASNGAVRMTGGTNSAPSSAGYADAATLTGRGWAVFTK